MITEVTLRVRVAPRERRYEGWSFSRFDEGVEAFRVMEQADASPDVARLSDVHETRLSMAMASSGRRRATGSLLPAAARPRGRLHRSSGSRVRRTTSSAGACERQLLRAGGGGPRPPTGRAWLRERYAAPYLRDELLDRGVLVETLETATSWSNLETPPRRSGDAANGARRAAAPRRSDVHVSHLYRSGASLCYLPRPAGRGTPRSVAGRQDLRLGRHRGGRRQSSTIARWAAIRAPWMRAEVGETGLELIRAAKERLDPAGS